MENLFRLSRYSLRSKTGKIRYPLNSTIRGSIGVYSTLGDAITIMQKIVETEDNLSTYCFYIQEFDLKIFWPKVVTERWYMNDGKLYDQYLKSDDDMSFRGRDPKDIRFKKGDVVEVLQRNGISLGMVCRTPLTKKGFQDREEWIKQNPEKCRSNYSYRLGKSANEYWTISLDEDDSQFQVFPASKLVSAKHKKALIAKRAEFLANWYGDEDSL